VWLGWATSGGAYGLSCQTGIKHGPWLEVHHSPPPSQNVWSAPANANGTQLAQPKGDRKFFLRKAKDWTTLAAEKELETVRKLAFSAFTKIGYSAFAILSTSTTSVRERGLWRGRSA